MRSMKLLIKPITLAVSLLLAAPLYADDNTLGAGIAADVHAILQKVNNLPDYITALVGFALNWTNTSDNDNNIPINGTLFGLFKIATDADRTTNLTYAQKMAGTFFGGNTPTFINDVSYATLLGTPPVPFTSGPLPAVMLQASQDAYMKTISGAAFTMTAPNDSWATGSTSRRDYYALYKTIAAMQSYNDLILSRLLTSQQAHVSYPSGVPGRPPGSQATTKDILAATVERATNSQWYSDVGSETLGLVLRQILIFNSQMYVLLTKMYENEQQMLITQAVTNSILLSTLSVGYGRILYTQALSGR